MQLGEVKEKTKDIAEHITDYAETWYKLTMLKAAQKGSGLASSGLIAAVLALLGLFVLLFASMALGWWLGGLVQNRALGFLIVAGFYLVCLLVLVALRKNTIFPYFRNLFIRKMYE